MMKGMRWWNSNFFYLQNDDKHVHDDDPSSFFMDAENIPKIFHVKEESKEDQDSPVPEIEFELPTMMSRKWNTLYDRWMFESPLHWSEFKRNGILETHEFPGHPASPSPYKLWKLDKNQVDINCMNIRGVKFSKEEFDLIAMPPLKIYEFQESHFVWTLIYEEETQTFIDHNASFTSEA